MRSFRNAPKATIFSRYFFLSANAVFAAVWLSGTLCLAVEWCLVRGQDSTCIVQQKWERSHRVWKGTGNSATSGLGTEEGTVSRKCQWRFSHLMRHLRYESRHPDETSYTTFVIWSVSVMCSFHMWLEYGQGNTWERSFVDEQGREGVRNHLNRRKSMF